MNTPDIETLLFKLNKPGNVYLHDEIEEALNHREALTPQLIKILEAVAENPQDYNIKGNKFHLYAAALLSHFGETDAHLPLIRAFSMAEEASDNIWSDVAFEILPSFLYKTCDGNIEAIKEMILNLEIDFLVRCSGMEALSYVVAFDPARRDEVVAFLQKLCTTEEVNRKPYFWAYLTRTLCDLHPGDSMEIIRKNFDDGNVPPNLIEWEEVEIHSEKSLEEAMEALQAMAVDQLPDDIHDTITWLAEFDETFHLLPSVKKSNNGPKKSVLRAKKKAARKVAKKSAKKPPKKKRR